MTRIIKSRLLKTGILLILAFILCMVSDKRSEASDNLKVYRGENATINSVSVEKNGSKLYVTSNGERKLIADKAGFRYAFDGEYVYYIVDGKSVQTKQLDDFHKSTVYRYAIATGEKKKLVAGHNLEISNVAKDKYIYMTFQKKNFIWDQWGMCVLDIKSCKMRNISNLNNVTAVYNNKIVLSYSGGDINYEGDLFSCNLDGTGKKKIAKGAFMGIKDGYVRYVIAKTSKNKLLVRGYRCNLDGTNKKALTKWKTELKFDFESFSAY